MPTLLFLYNSNDSASQLCQYLPLLILFLTQLSCFQLQVTRLKRKSWLICINLFIYILLFTSFYLKGLSLILQLLLPSRSNGDIFYQIREYNRTWSSLLRLRAKLKLSRLLEPFKFISIYYQSLLGVKDCCINT